jgi:hypothetical protein
MIAAETLFRHVSAQRMTIHATQINILSSKTTITMMKRAQCIHSHTLRKLVHTTDSSTLKSEASEMIMIKAPSI